MKRIVFTGHRDCVCPEQELAAIAEEYPGAVWIHGDLEETCFQCGQELTVNEAALNRGRCDRCYESEYPEEVQNGR